MARILLVEDDAQLRAMLKLLLTSSGYEVLEASNGTQVCDLHQQHRFDLVITDLVMPDTEGLGVILNLRRMDQNVKVIAMSGGGISRGGADRGEEYLITARKLGAQLTLSKPFENEEFLAAVCEILKGGSDQQEIH